MPDRAENNFAIMRCCARVVPLRIVNKKFAQVRAQGAAFRPNADSQTNELLRGVRRPKGRERPRIEKMTQDEMIKWFKSAPKSSRHERMLWAARKIAHLTEVTEGC